MITKKIKNYLFAFILPFSSSLFAQTTVTLAYKYPLNLADKNAPYAVSKVMSFQPDDIIQSSLPKAEQGDVLAQWLVAEAYSKKPQWTEEGSKWVFIATLSTLMDASICSNGDDNKYVLYYVNQLFGNSVRDARFHPEFLKPALIKARDFLLVKNWVSTPAYFPTEVCNLKKDQKATDTLYKNPADWSVIRNKVFDDFLKTGNVDPIPDKNKDTKKYQGPAWINE